jgi:mRNA interferase MazF
VIGIKYNQREIVLVPFPYSDLSSSKKRPCLIVSNKKYNNGHDDVIVCVITSNLFKDDYSIVLNNSDLEFGILPEESVTKVHKLFTIDKKKVIKKFSVIEKDYFIKVNSALNNLFSVD